MNCETLHLCNAKHQNNIDEYIPLIKKHDAVVFYSESINSIDYENLKKLCPDNPIYFVIDNNNHELDTICYNDWLNLVNLYKKTFTWK